jgi:hypothetical protein
LFLFCFECGGAITLIAKVPAESVVVVALVAIAGGVTTSGVVTWYCVLVGKFNAISFSLTMI